MIPLIPFIALTATAGAIGTRYYRNNRDRLYYNRLCYYLSDNHICFPGRNFDCNNQMVFGVPLLIYAAREQDITLLKLLLKVKARLNVRDENGNTALHIAVQKDYVYIIFMLLEAGADVNALNDKGETPLFYVKSSEAVNALAKGKAEMNPLDAQGNPPFTDLQDMKLFDALFSSGVNPAPYMSHLDIKESLKYKRLCNKSKSLQMTDEFLKAIEDRDFEQVRKSLDSTISPDARFHDQCAVTYFVTHRDKDMAMLFLDAGAIIDRADFPAIIVVLQENDDQELIDKLVENGLRLNTQALKLAINKSNKTLAKAAIPHCPKEYLYYNPVTTEYESLLARAIRRNEIEIVKCMLNNGAQINHPDVRFAFEDTLERKQCDMFELLDSYGLKLSRF